jgi:hypothetical protein
MANQSGYFRLKPDLEAAGQAAYQEVLQLPEVGPPNGFSGQERGL